MKGESWITMEWIVKTFLKNKIAPEIGNHRDNNGATIKDLAKDKSKQWKENAPYSYTFSGLNSWNVSEFNSMCALYYYSVL